MSDNNILVYQCFLGSDGTNRTFRVKDREKASEIVEDINIFVSKKLREIEKAPIQPEEEQP